MTATARFPVGLEEGADGVFLAHALTLPGCAASGPTAEAALDAFGRELAAWLRFLDATGEPAPPPDAELELSVDEWLRTGARVSAGETTACFAADLAPLGEDETRDGLRRLGDLRGRLLARLRGRPEAILDAETAEGWTVRRLLDELARAQWWTLSRLGASPMAEVPERTLARLDTAMALVVQNLGHLPDERRAMRLEIDGEEWTPRKVLRRLLALEWTLGGAALSVLAVLDGEVGG